MKKSLFVWGALVLALAMHVNTSRADEQGHDDNQACPVGLVSGMTLEQEFGAQVAANTRCIKKRHDVNTLIQINNFCELPGYNTTTCPQPYALNQINNILNDYEITDGMVPGRDFNVVAVVHGQGGFLLLNGNKFQSVVQGLMARGVTFYFCENTVRGFIKQGLLTQGDVANGVIPGVKYVTAGVAAIADFQSLGYKYVQP